MGGVGLAPREKAGNVNIEIHVSSTITFMILEVDATFTFEHF
jgi:hypothetical protein